LNAFGKSTCVRFAQRAVEGLWNALGRATPLIDPVTSECICGRRKRHAAREFTASAGLAWIAVKRLHA
jgi:hypothetical protein